MNDEDMFVHQLFLKQMHLLAYERTGWRRYIFGRFPYSCEPFRNDIARLLKSRDTQLCVPKGMRIIE